ncbi:MAG TPA: hypothetical protein VFM98_22135 [Ramlibacter sp.]|uniref:hypothetical protein n=1 Tax=Ramlibacter sp. TaxID=1917967 RepID=UPI002D804274|nr:hypothetical protein [Ramlibacter sp.]HET8748311.1 hypothetical protein [Ramlibacter sp.]
MPNDHAPLSPLSCGTDEADESGSQFEIGVCDERFNVYARIVMRDADGARRLESDLAGMGYEPVTQGSGARQRGCDLLMVRRAVLAGMSLR